ncbi:MAG: hypothetical protein AB8I58_21960 [Anaerolineales bacterium]
MKSLPTLTQPAAYRIRMVGRVRNGWADFMTGLREVVSQDGDKSITELTGTVPDQPALFGLLCHIRDLGLPLLSVEFVETQKGE